jgi:hypothetical protein
MKFHSLFPLAFSTILAAPAPKPDPGIGKAILITGGVGLGALGAYSGISAISNHHRAKVINEKIAMLQATSQQQQALDTPIAPI